MFTKTKLAKSVTLAMAFGAFAGLGTTSTAFAQDSSADNIDDVEKITVTGSKIRGANLESISPLQILDAGDIDTAGIANLQELLLENPTFGTPAISRTNSNFSTASAGVATIDLRNLGTARTLVLVNGRRYVAGQPGSTAVDLNTIPAQFVERVEILTGGASSVYGSDAVAGVVNFVLKDNFEGLEAGVQYGESSEGDNTERQFNLTSGLSSADGNGNIMFHLSYTDEGGVFSRDRDRSDVDIISEALFTGDGDDFFTAREPFFSSFPPQGRFDLGDTRYTFDRNNNLQNGFSTNGNESIGPDGFNRNGQRTIAIPTERYMFASVGSYDLNDNHSIFFEGTYAKTQTITELEPFPFASDDIYADGLVPYEFEVDGQILLNPFVPSSIAALGADGNGDGFKDYFFAKRLSNVGNRGNRADRDAYRFTVGIEGTVFEDYFYDLYYVYGQTNESQVSGGLVNVQNFRYALEAVTDTLDLDGDGITNEAVCLDATARSFGCVPVNIWGFNAITPEAAAYVTAPSLLITSIEQEIIGGSISGDVLELPAGFLSFAGGFEYREEKSRDEFDPLQQAGLNAGNAIPATFGDFDVTEFYLEANVPIIEDLSLRAAVRTSDYSTVGSTLSWNAGVEWQVTDWLRLRAIEAQSTRAPNINELFQAPSQTFPTGLNDPCLSATPSAQCLADPGVAANIAENGTFTLNQADIQGISGFNRGNPDLFEEEGRSTTIGAILAFDETGIDILQNLSVTLDYFDIEIKDAIVSTPRQFILDQCYGGGDTSFCEFVTRRAVSAGNNSAGSLEFIDSGASNSGGLSTEGIDLTAQYFTDLGAGVLRGRIAYTYVIDGETIPLPGATPNPFVGEVGASEHRWNLNLGYQVGDFNINVSTTYIGEATLDDQFLASFSNVTDANSTVDAEIYVDLQASYFIADGIEVYAGLDNALDNDPPFLPSGLPGQDTGTETDAGTYDPIGRQYYVGVRTRF